MPSSHPVIVIPGVTATYLRDLYPLPPETIWSVMRKDFERAEMHPNNLRYEAGQPAIMRPDQLYEIAYKELIEELRYNLSESAEKPVPVFPFSYDWRHPLNITEDMLADFIDEVIERTKLLRHYHEDGFSDAPKVNLVGHSMGGMVIAGYVDKFGTDKVNKIATLATPFKGSFEAIVKMATGTANIGGSLPSSREREAARLTPSLYHLLPSFKTGINVAPGSGLPKSTFKPELWQPSILETIVTYIDRHAVDRGRNKAERKKQGAALFKKLLDQAGGHRKRVDKLALADKGFDANRWLCVVGAGCETRVRMEVNLDRGKPFFKLTKDDRLDQWDEEDKKLRLLTGDGTVHFKGAVPEFLPYESLVCVTPDDYGYWELADRVTTRAGGFHGILPNMNMVHRMLVRHFTGWGDSKKNTWGRPAPGVSADEWQPPLKLTPK